MSRPSLSLPADVPVLGDSLAIADPIYQTDSGYESMSTLVERIRTGKTEGMEELDALFGKGIRFYVYRQLGTQEIDDKLQDVFVKVIEAIRRGELNEPRRLMEFVRTIVRKMVTSDRDPKVCLRRAPMDPRWNAENR